MQHANNIIYDIQIFFSQEELLLPSAEEFIGKKHKIEVYVLS